MKKPFLLPGAVRLPFFGVAILTAVALCDVPGWAQNAIYQRDFPISVAEAQAAVRSIDPASKGRLPTLAGFVQQSDSPIERYDKGYYQCTFEISPSAAGGTTIQVSAKVTSWYNDPDASRSGYRVLISNGRLEADALDRIAERVAPKTPPVAAPSSEPQPFVKAAGVGIHSGLGSTAVPKPRAGAELPAAPPAGDNPESLRALREAEEKKSSELSSYIQNLEQIQRTQSHPNDLGAVKNPRTPVFSKPSESAPVLLYAEAQDEFQILAMDGTWVHVQISGVSRGWIRRAQLEMPPGFRPSGGTSAEATGTSEAIFKVTRENESRFNGSWPPLKGKAVRIEWVQPSDPAKATSQKEKLAFAKTVFLHTYQKLDSAPAGTDGIVVVFDSADGGQIAATMSTVKGLVDRTVSDAAFWRQCSLDPPDSFAGYAKP